VTWGAPLRASEAEFCAPLAAKEQRSIRTGRRLARESGVELQVLPLSARVLEEFLPVYDAQVAGMANGVPYLRFRRARLLEEADAHVAVLARLDGSCVGGCICRVHADLAMIRVAFAATSPRSRLAMLTRVLYMVAAQHGRDLGLRWMSLGSDPALYGEVAMPGLFAFKARLGFVPVPLCCFDPDDSDATDVAEAVLSLRALSDPALSLRYGSPAGLSRHWHWSDPPRWQLRVLSARADLDIRPYHAPFVERTELEVVPGPLELAASA
jgi:hypothetical protein